MKFLTHLSEEDFRRIEKKLKEEDKLVRTGKSRSFYLAEYVSMDKVVDFVLLQHENFKMKFKEEMERADKFLRDPIEAEKSGFNNQKQKSEDIIAWADKAYPTIDENRWSLDFEKEIFEREKV